MTVADAERLSFGSFLTPSAADPEFAIRAATAAEDAGLDLVTFQDHPYQTSFLDTWTLLSFVAARTSRVQLSGNVLNLPLRPPAMLARAAASLDILSGGRVTLGLGAGFFWDAISTMGVDQLTAGQSLDALEEAVGLIREIWDTDRTSRIQHAGDFYRLDGMRRGPMPAHTIPIWLGGYKPRSLRIVGRSADGWMSSLGPDQSLDQQRESNAAIDRSAVSAGRRPDEIRRSVNIPLSAATPAQLAELASRAGFDTFILASDDIDRIEDFGRRVAPETRRLLREARRTE